MWMRALNKSFDFRWKLVARKLIEEVHSNRDNVKVMMSNLEMY